MYSYAYNINNTPLHENSLHSHNMTQTQKSRGKKYFKIISNIKDFLGLVTTQLLLAKGNVHRLNFILLQFLIS